MELRHDDNGYVSVIEVKWSDDGDMLWIARPGQDVADAQLLYETQARQLYDYLARRYEAEPAEEDDDDYCEVCGGTGDVETDDYEIESCDWCGGSGSMS